MGIFPLFDLKKELFHPYLSTKWGEEVEIWYVYLVGVQAVRFGRIRLFSPKKVVF